MDSNKNHLDGIACFFDKAIREIAGFKNNIKLFDFGCGTGQLIKDLEKYGYDSYGADVYLRPESISNQDHKIRQIQTNPYKLPFTDNDFDIVISTSVLEHALNTEECFKEIHRILKRSIQNKFTILQ